MPCLTNLRVKKVSFVRRGANKKEFFLAKTADFSATNNDGGEEESGNGEAFNNEIQSGGRKPMRPEIRLRLGDILKKERDMDRVCALLKEDSVLKATEAEVAEVRDFIALIPPPDPTIALELQKAADAKKDAEEAQAKAEGELTKIRESNHRSEVKKWVEDNCKYANLTNDEATDQILKAEKVDLVTAEMLKKSFKGTSDALASSELLKEAGRSGEARDFDAVGGNLVMDVSKMANEIKKSGTVKQSDAILAAIKSAGPVRYESYRKEFNRRARTY
jgi:hypothetical protein